MPFLAEARRTAEAAENGYASIRRRELEASQSALSGLRGLAEDLRCALVTGVGAGDPLGVAVGLATAAALEGRRVVLIECDLARPALAQHLRLAPTPGLAEYLSWEATAPQILRPLDLSGAAVGAHGPVGQLVCVVAGSATGDGAGLIATESFDGAMRNVRRGYELVVLLWRSSHEPEIQALASVRGCDRPLRDQRRVRRVFGPDARRRPSPPLPASGRPRAGCRLSPPVDAERIRAGMAEVAAEHGPWHSHNIHLGHGVWTLTEREPVENSRLRRYLQAVSDAAGGSLAGLRVLDLACEEGGFGIEMARQGAEVVASRAGP